MQGSFILQILIYTSFHPKATGIVLVHQELGMTWSQEWYWGSWGWNSYCIIGKWRFVMSITCKIFVFPPLSSHCWCPSLLFQEVFPSWATIYVKNHNCFHCCVCRNDLFVNAFTRWFTSSLSFWGTIFLFCYRHINLMLLFILLMWHSGASYLLISSCTVIWKNGA